MKDFRVKVKDLSRTVYSLRPLHRALMRIKSMSTSTESNEGSVSASFEELTIKEENSNSDYQYHSMIDISSDVKMEWRNSFT